MAGWIKLHRDIESWEWIDDEFMYWFFTRLVMMANIEDKKWQGNIVKRGELITSYGNLADRFKCGSQKIRTAISRLVDTKEITIKTTNKFTVISIVKYDEWQSTDSVDNKQITNQKQTDNNQITTTKELNNTKNIRKKNTTSASPDALAVLDAFNRICGKSLSPTASNLKEINARLNEKIKLKQDFVLSDFELVIQHKYREWDQNAEMSQYLRPQTLFGGKFESYLGVAKNPVKSFQDKLGDFFAEHNISPMQK